MIKSVHFPKKGNGYIYNKPVRPEKPDKHDPIYRSFNSKTHKNDFKEEKYNVDLEQYEKELEWYNEHKGKFVLPCSKNLVGKTFDFEDSKVNLIFGPNGSGKSTIIKAIAGEALVSDGLVTIHEPIELGLWGEDDIEECVKKYADKLKKNSCVVEWDGTPLYFDNFEETARRNYGIFGGMTGSAIQSVSDEMIYRIGSSRISAGQNTAYIMNKIFRICANDVSTMDLINSKYKDFRKGNSSWSSCAEAQLEYFKKHGDIEKKAPITLIFDEVDKSLDIQTVWSMYTELFPAIIEKKHVQIILVSHNPLVLSDKIFNNPLYNVISIDPEYTKEVRELLHEVSF